MKDYKTKTLPKSKLKLIAKILVANIATQLDGLSIGDDDGLTEEDILIIVYEANTYGDKLLKSHIKTSELSKIVEYVKSL